MIDRRMAPEAEETVQSRTASFYREHRQIIYVETDKMFAGLLLFQWLAGVAIALFLSPRTWSGTRSSVHPHVWTALWLGAALSLFPVLVIWARPGSALSRHTIAAAQMLTSSLLIHITGGRIETHFHVFGSLAFLAFYRDWRVLLTASAVTALDHLIKGVFWPVSLYGDGFSSAWRWAEHSGWVLFCDVFLIRSSLRSDAEMMDIAMKQAHNRHLLYQAQHDALTGLPNRILFVETLEKGMAEARDHGRKLALLSVDLNNFKRINDTHGHQTGDLLLRAAGERLAKRLHPGETLARLGGDEFAVVQTGIESVSAAESAAERLLGALTHPFSISGQLLCIGASIGICMYPDFAGDARELQEHADVAMYRAKRRGVDGLETFSACREPYQRRQRLSDDEAEAPVQSSLLYPEQTHAGASV